MARNLIADFYRKKAKVEKEKKSLQEPPREGLLESMEKKILFKNIFKVMGRLPKSYQDILILLYVEDLKPKEISQIYQITEKNVSVRKRRALKKLDFLLAKNNFLW